MPTSARCSRARCSSSARCSSARASRRRRASAAAAAVSAGSAACSAASAAASRRWRAPASALRAAACSASRRAALGVAAPAVVVVAGLAGGLDVGLQGAAQGLAGDAGAGEGLVGRRDDLQLALGGVVQHVAALHVVAIGAVGLGDPAVAAAFGAAGEAKLHRHQRRRAHGGVELLADARLAADREGHGGGAAHLALPGLADLAGGGDADASGVAHGGVPGSRCS